MLAVYLVGLAVILIAWVLAFFRPGPAIALLIALYVVKQALQIRFNIFSTYSPLCNAMIAVTGGLCYLRLSLKGKTIRSNSRLLGFRNAFVLLACASVLWSGDTSYTGDSWKLWFLYIAALVILMPMLMRAEDNLRSMLRSYAWIGMALCLILFFAAEWNGRVVTFAGDTSVYNFKQGRNYAMVGNPLEVASTCVYLILVMILVNAAGLGRILNLLRWPAVILAVALLLKSGSRGQVIVLCMVLPLMYPLTRRIQSMKSVLGGMLGIAGILAVLYWIYLFVQQGGRWSDALVERDVGIRTYILSQSLYVWTQTGSLYFLFGHGLDSSLNPAWDIGFPEVGPAAVLVDVGLVGAILWVSLLILTAKSWLRSYWLVMRDDARRSLVVALGAMALSTFALSFKQGGYFAILGWCMLIGRYEVLLSESLGARAELEPETESLPQLAATPA